MKLCIALDNPNKEDNLKLAKEIKEYSKEIWLKVGFRSYIRDGNEFIFELKNLGYNIFLDLKLYDIPNTMADAAEEIAKKCNISIEKVEEILKELRWNYVLPLTTQKEKII